MKTLSARRMGVVAVVLTVGLMASASEAAVRITEVMSEGQGDVDPGNGGRRQRECFELTNLGSAAVDVSGWSYNDNNVNDPHAFGAPYTTGAYGPGITSIGAGESVIFTQMPAADFRALWNLPTSVQVYSYLQLSNLGNADTINIYNSTVQDATTLVDALTYTAEARGSGVSRNRPLGGDGATLNADWLVSSAGDVYGSFLVPNPPSFAAPYDNPANYADLANPGSYVPEPTSATLLAAVAIVRRRRRSDGATPIIVEDESHRVRGTVRSESGDGSPKRYGSYVWNNAPMGLQTCSCWF